MPHTHQDARPLVRVTLLAMAALCVGCGPGAPDWVEEDGYRWAELRVSGEDEPGFERLDPSETGISFENVVTETQYIENSHYLNGSGVAAGDVDGDGRVDLYFAGMDGPNRLYRNLGGWRFEEIAEEAGVAAADRFSTGAAFADVDGDGDLDLLVHALGGPNALYLNDGTGRFADGTEAAGLSSTLGSMSMTLADIDGDGDLDLYVVNNKVATVQDLFPPVDMQPSNIYRQSEGGFEILPEWREHFTLGEVREGMVPRLELAEPDRLYLNDGTGRFTPVPWTEGAFLDEEGRPLQAEPLEWGLAARFQDVDGDGDPDLYVCNDFHSPDHIWINDGTGRFRMLDPLAMRSTSFASMAVDFSDVDRDGFTDFFVAEMLSREQRLRMKQIVGGVADPQFAGRIRNRPQKPRNTLYLSRGDGTFAEAAQFAGLDASGWSWGSTFMDVDLDGFEDLLVGTGHFYDAMDKDAAQRVGSMDWRQRILGFPPLRLSNVAFRNRGDLTFEEVGEAWSFAGDEDITHGMATADLDGDGDLDVVTNRLLAPAGVYRNVGRAPRVAVRLVGRGLNTDGVGAQIRLSGSGLPVQTKEIVAGGLYLSGSEAMASFAAAGGEMTIEVVWRGGMVSRVEGVSANRIYEIREPAAGGAASAAGAGSAGATESEAPLFDDVSELLGHRHRENSFDDFAQQPLITWRLGQGGPGVAWTDIDGDGDSDALVGGGGGAGLSVFRNDGAGGFSPDRGARGDGAAGPAPSPGDQTGLVIVPGRAGATVVVGTATYDGTDRAAASATLLRASGSVLREAQTLPAAESSTGPLAAADVDGDGDVDLFAGGRVVPGQYPAAATSRLFLNEGGRYVLDESNAAVLAGLGLVSGAVFSDLDADGDPDLLLAVEWGPVRLLVNRDGRFEDATAAFGLESRTGWWNGVTTGDLNEDGLPDVIASNRGLNSQFTASSEHPATAYHADLDNDGFRDVIEARYDEFTRAMVPVRGLLTLAGGLPFLRGRIQGFEHYGQLGVNEILEQPADLLPTVEATTLAHTVFINRGGSFEAFDLPRESQLAPAFHAGVADMDGDGHEDVFLSQNLFALRGEADRNDGGRGLWLRGDGTGALTPVPGQRSGIAVYGEQRGAAFADYDGDGRVDVLVSQNAAGTKLYRNTGAKPGLRVRLRGGPGNPAAIGAAIRLEYAGGALGPLRAVRAGGGYWSQDDPVQVMGLAAEPTAVRVRWPDGSETVTPLDAPTPLEVTIEATGALAARR
ncbi:FG-GAP-like repeat-containing protein [Candidatus Palauibacter polyketidifaciens]|uniref:FG-GAP-like repeat-containing protein n=1 Tax=Candidatus Palauibacter polyketidifaciens TaxID=3056740 RepID=UPI0023A0F8DE|nr:FG-GAP-like repeat-containing protein [Candidatus Palauibacter polyketidifaciens]MDE2721218.1 FG-GAP-like repeat-containing protein [Candidatus Palauibacter polyketidifaciens]